ncbi:MAG: hypothetical protein KAR42_12565 [candidate division Zixibacteria bacterium]|nr:hypothetical protein [candidate division Zixibacteria bacterium]
MDRKKMIWGSLIIAVVIASVWSGQSNQQWKPNSTYESWVTISYSGLIDRETLTHNGETVGAIISQIPHYEDEYKGLVQPYLEPFSILCHDVILSINGPDTLPLINILNHYPIGSAQPAWVALFREGHYQLYYNKKIIRVFIKGAYVSHSLERHQSVIRHAIRDVINSEHTAIEKIEIYSFLNDYAPTSIRLNTEPLSFTLDEFDLAPRKKSIDLESIEEFLNEGVILKAVEVDANNDLYFYGRKAENQTLAGSPISLADLAVIYRSIFHYGYNSPYISLDKHEDNRFAKVNFGGNLENTHAGHVVLEADKLFKALSTGLDPNTHKVITKQIRQNVPSFLTEDERSLQERSDSSHMQIRYWFYPDSIGTVTDGSIGAILTHQFLADVERMDISASVGNAVRSTIEHLNRNYGQYEKAFMAFRELSTVGRIMSLINWLKGMEMDTRIELDELLSVEIPAFTTQKKTKKMLAVTAIAYPEYSSLTTRNVREYSKSYYISNLLDKYDPKSTDSIFLKAASAYYEGLDANDLTPSRYRELQSQVEYYTKLITAHELKMISLDGQIKTSERTLNNNNYSAINRHNELVDEYNSQLQIQDDNINKCNSTIDELNNMNIMLNCITSIGGGISLRPNKFKQIAHSKNAPKIREITSLKSKIRSVGKIAKSGNWIRSNAGKGGAKLNSLSVREWSLSKSANGSIEHDYVSGKSNWLTVSVSQEGGGWRSEINVNGFNDIVEYSEGRNSLQVTHSSLKVSGLGSISADGKRIVFSQ